MEKLKESVYYQKVDLNDSMKAFDRYFTGNVAQEEFVKGLQLSRVDFNDGEINEILSVAPCDVNGKVRYKEFQRKLKTEHFEEKRTAKHPLDSSQFTQEAKLATILNAELKTFGKSIVDEDDLYLLCGRSWVRVDEKYLRDVTPGLPRNKKKLKKWAKKRKVKGMKMKVNKNVEESVLHPYPVILVRLRDLAVYYGVDVVVSTMRYRDFLVSQDLYSIFQKFSVIRRDNEFGEFREWAVHEGIMRLHNGDLVIDSTMFCKFFDDLREEVPIAHATSTKNEDLQDILDGIIRNLVMEKVKTIGDFMRAQGRNDYIEEHSFRSILSRTIPGLPPEHITKIISSLKTTTFSGPSRPFKQLCIPEFLGLLLNVEFNPSSKPIDRLPTPSIEPPSPIAKLDHSFLLPQDRNWEMKTLKHVYQAHTELLANFRIIDTRNKGSLVLEEFHYTLKNTFPWMNSQEINYLTSFAIHEAGCIDEGLTALTQEDLEGHSKSLTVSYALYPDGTRYRIAFMYFLVCLERIMNV